MILLLHGAKKNVGDYLIRERGLALLRRVRPEAEIVLHERWKPIPDELLNRADAVVLCGGPGLAADFYPGVFPLVGDLDALPKPILPLALGWSGVPMRDPEGFEFDANSKRALVAIHEQIGWSGVRDEISLRIVERASVGSSRMTGCVAWYDMPFFDVPLHRPRRVASVVFTPPARALRLYTESLGLMRMIGRRYPNAERFCVFHRGLQRDNFTSGPDARIARSFGLAARALGFEVVDAAFDLSKIGFYSNVDLHVGYRVHAHLHFLSQRRPSILIAEDGRGLGQLETLNDPYRLVAGDRDLGPRVDAALAAEESTFEGLGRAVDVMRRTWPAMHETLDQLPRVER